MRIRLLLVPALALIGASDLFAQAPQCNTAEYRQFDFWVGSWEVTTGGKPAGTNEIVLEEDGCVLTERWLGAGGTTGRSLNFYDRATGKWHQTWIDNGGNALALAGGFAGGKMTLEGKTGQAGSVAHQRITWSKNDDGSVRQLWESSNDGGKTWTTAFDGLYRKRTKP